MGVILIVIFIVILLLIAVASPDSVTHEDNREPPEELPGEPMHHTWEKNYFINKHLHRDDKALERHKRNQFPY